MTKKGCDAMQEQKNVLKQKNKYRWRDHPPKIDRDEVAAAFACADDKESNKCDCWHTACRYYDNCKACLVFHMRLNQFPTCQRDMLEEWGVDYIAKTT